MKQYCAGYLDREGKPFPATLFGFDSNVSRVAHRVGELNRSQPDREWFVLERDVPEWEILAEDPEISDGVLKV